MNFLEELKKPRTILVTALILYVIGKLILLSNYHDVRWDEAVYLVMSQYILSGGQTGFWEALRPPLWPLMLAIIAGIGIDPVLGGEILAATLGALGAIYLYKTLQEYVHELLAASTATLLLATNIWFWGSSQLLTGVPSASLLIIGLYLYNKKRYLLAGIILAAAALTRYPVGLGLIAVGLTHLYTMYQNKYDKQSLTELAQTILGAATLLLPWMITNAFVYTDKGLQAPIQPLLEGGGNVFFFNTWLHNTQPLYYFEHLLTLLPITLLTLIGILYVHKHQRLIPYALLTLFTLTFFTLLPNNQWRFALLILPGVLVLTALGAQKISEYKKPLLYVLTALILLNAAVLAVNNTEYFSHRGEEPASIETNYYRFLEEHPVNGTIYVSDPIVAYYAENKATPIYYEFLEDKEELMKQEAAAVFFIPRSTPCHPEDTRCKENLEAFTSHLIETYTLVHVYEHNTYKHYVFSNQIPLQALPTEEIWQELIHVTNNPPRE
ncbi:MAG: ArnT family glycosyltransferase [Candidatus Woesearchaeota archaeon]